MKIETQITRADFEAFSKYLSRASAKKPGYRFALLLGIPFGIGGGLLAAKLEPNQNSAAPILLITGFVLGVAFMYSLALLTAAAIRRKLGPSPSGYLLRRQVIETSDDALQVTSETHHAEFRWNLIPGPEITRDHIFVMVDAIAAIIVPTRCFSTDDERKQFVSDIRGRSKRTRSYQEEP